MIEVTIRNGRPSISTTDLRAAIGPKIYEIRDRARRLAQDDNSPVEDGDPVLITKNGTAVGKYIPLDADDETNDLGFTVGGDDGDAESAREE